MRILLTNDDGVEAGGLRSLEKQLQMMGQVTVIAPLTEQSGVGHGITYRSALSVQQQNQDVYAVDGMPADCVKFGLHHVFQQPPDLIVSGINAGLNLGCNVFYSGTVAAAVEGAIYGITSLAVSCPSAKLAQLPATARCAREALEAVLSDAPRGKAYNVNLPDVGKDVPKMVFTYHRPRAFPEEYLRTDGEEGDEFHLNMPSDREYRIQSSSDVAVIEEGNVSVTPLCTSLTDSELLEKLSGNE
ncbi:MAG: 5'/3'-nucleotidase SurE [Candidatus Brocadiia bacterium]